MDWSRLNLPEALLLLCEEPRTGRLVRPSRLRWALAGAVLTELMLAGAIEVDDRHIVSAHPVPTADPFADELLEELRTALRRGRPLRLADRVGLAAFGAVRFYLGSLRTKGLATARRRRFAGLVPYTVYTSDQPGWSAPAADRIRQELSGPSDPRVLSLAAFASMVNLDRRLFRGPGSPALRRSISRLVDVDPIARAAHSVIVDSQSGGG